jgi:hypothetical protein
MLGQPVGYHVVLTLALLSDHRLDRTAESNLISKGAGSNEVQ